VTIAASAVIWMYLAGLWSQIYKTIHQNEAEVALFQTVPSSWVQTQRFQRFFMKSLIKNWHKYRNLDSGKRLFLGWHPAKQANLI
jgi:hypothetical protein